MYSRIHYICLFNSQQIFGPVMPFVPYGILAPSFATKLTSFFHSLVPSSTQKLDPQGGLYIGESG